MADTDPQELGLDLEVKPEPEAEHVSETKEDVAEELPRKDCLTVGLGSCLFQEFPSLDTVHKMTSLKPDVVALLGDTVYLDEKFRSCVPHTLCCYRFGHCSQSYAQPQDVDDIKETWANLTSQVQFSEEATSDGRPPAVLVTWDDHDYGWDNATQENLLKKDTREALLKFFHDENAGRKDVLESVEFLEQNPDRGVHYYNDQKCVLPDGCVLKVRFVMLDARWYRKKKDILGDAQKKWFEDEAMANGVEDMDWVVLGSGSTFLLGAGLGEDGYDQDTREWLLAQLDTAGIRKRSIILSGDVHFSMILEAAGGSPPEYVASSFTHSLGCCLFNCGVGTFLREDQPNLCLRTLCCCCKAHVRRDTLQTWGTPVDSRVNRQTWCCCLPPWCGVCLCCCGSYMHTATNENGFGWMQMTKDEVMYEYRDADGNPVLKHTIKREH